MSWALVVGCGCAGSVLKTLLQSDGGWAWRAASGRQNANRAWRSIRSISTEPPREAVGPGLCAVESFVGFFDLSRAQLVLRIVQPSFNPHTHADQLRLNP